MLLSIRDAQHALDQGDCDRAEAISAQIVDQEPRNAAAWHVLGVARHKLGRLEPALDALSKATRHERGVARYHHDLGNALIDDGKLDRAISAFRQALRVDDGVAEVHNDLGAAYFQKGWHAEAEACFRKAIERRLEHGIAYANLGAALRAQGHLGESRRAYQRALLLKLRALLPRPLRWRVAQPPTRPAASSTAREQIRKDLKAIADEIAAKRPTQALALAQRAEASYPEDPEVLHAAALAYEEAKELPAALERSRAAVAGAPDRAEFRILRARLLVKSGEHQAALEAALEALRLEPGSADVHAMISGICHPWRDDIAINAARRAIELDPASHMGHANLGAALWGMGQLDDAERHAREAVRLKAGHIGYRTNLALICKDQGLLDEARGIYRELLAQAPDHPKLALDLGTLAVECEGDLDAARRWYRKAQSSGEARPRLSEAILDLMEGKFETGWDRYEVRKLVPDQRYHHSLFAGLPRWNFEPLSGRLLAYGEQGLGDEIMFASMFEDLAKRVDDVALMCDARLGRLFERSFPRFKVIAEPRDTQGERVKSLAGIAAAIAAGSLGALYRRRRDDFPPHKGYLKADPEKVARWKARLGPGRHAGISWVGGLQKTGRSRRSVTLEALRPVLELPGLQWVSLQHGVAGSPLREFPGVTEDLDELAGLIGALDAVVSVCNTNVHLAGACGKEALVMAPFVPEWRYGLAGDMLWYPSARVFRQARYGDWSSVIDGVIARLAQIASQ